MGMLVARKISLKDYEEYDLILAMDSGHLALLEQQATKGAKAEIALYLPYSGVIVMTDVPDPYYQKDAAFNQVLDLVEAASIGLVALLKQKVV